MSESVSNDTAKEIEWCFFREAKYVVNHDLDS